SPELFPVCPLPPECDRSLRVRTGAQLASACDEQPAAARDLLSVPMGAGLRRRALRVARDAWHHQLGEDRPRGRPSAHRTRRACAGGGARHPGRHAPGGGREPPVSQTRTDDAIRASVRPPATPRQGAPFTPAWAQRPGTQLLLPLALVVAFVSHGLNMFAYPLYLGDEGIYMEQAWAVLKGLGLTPYTYTYDHAPAGWLLIAAWLRLLPGGVAQWGMAENSGRVLMLLLALG